MSAVEQATSWYWWIARVMLGAEMELLRGPLFFALGLACLVLLWRRTVYAGAFPNDLKTWRELIFRSSAAIALSYSTIVALVDVPLVSLIGFVFAILTLGLSRFGGEDRAFLRSLGWLALAFGLLLGLLRPEAVS